MLSAQNFSVHTILIRASSAPPGPLCPCNSLKATLNIRLTKSFVSASITGNRSIWFIGKAMATTKIHECRPLTSTALTSLPISIEPRMARPKGGMMIGSTYRCHVSYTYHITIYLIRGCYTFDCHILNHVSGFYVPRFHVTHILIRADPVYATFPNAISICGGMSPTPHHSLHRARKISCHNSRTLA
jgi:hypothetical protein